MNLNELLNWRYAAKRMNGAKVPSEKIDAILENIRLSASSIGLQPYRILVIDTPELLAKIKPIAGNQAQITEASHLLVFAALENLSAGHIEEFIDTTARERNVTKESLVTLKAYLDSLLKNPAEQNFAWAARQAYIALGTALIAAAEQEVDATPMEGFSPEALDELLELKKLGLRSVALLTLGYRDEENDWNLKLPKVRLPKEKLFIEKV